ncbi:hypothetical protein GN244_ATG02051 [Phytophthora infestans]|uniref:Uncharacterized protein n=1 Tax=Phytophthora infestans TaxID=4787 RepID=A0A833STC7_PHYIN|nr:hypothetical protein GN244_ATG02051 [Phytophthora infestans]KAF4140027.1 hypothetical protein GN958_ATG10777 [Phytophthora infestans]
MTSVCLPARNVQFLRQTACSAGYVELSLECTSRSVSLTEQRRLAPLFAQRLVAGNMTSISCLVPERYKSPVYYSERVTWSETRWANGVVALCEESVSACQFDIVKSLVQGGQFKMKLCGYLSTDAKPSISPEIVE